MAFDSIIQDGKFTATGNDVTLKLRSGVNKLVVENYTQWLQVTMDMDLNSLGIQN